jgi:Short chain fatty acid transporter
VRSRGARTLTLLAWVPLLAVSIAQGHAWGGSVALPFVYDIELHVRLLLALPLLVVAGCDGGHAAHLPVLHGADFDRGAVLGSLERRPVVIQGYVTVTAASAVGAPVQQGLLALSIGDQMENLVTPFWAAVGAGIARVDFRRFIIDPTVNSASPGAPQPRRAIDRPGPISTR